MSRRPPRPGPPVRDRVARSALRWPAPDRVGVVAEVPAAGVFLGADRDGRPVALPAVRPRPVRLGLVGGHGAAAVLALRLVAVGCQVTAVTAGAPAWHALRTRVPPPRLTLADRPVHWPPAPAGPPGTDPGPQALVVDIATALPRWLGNAPWCTVVQVASVSPPDAAFLDGLDALVLTRPGYAVLAARRWPRPDAAAADDLRRGEVAVADQIATRPVALALTPPERDLWSR